MTLHYRFTGQRIEDNVDLYFYNSRWYDPVVGRFIQPDTIVPEPGNPQNLNRYTYVLNSPVLYTDPSGHCIPGVSCPGTGAAADSPGEEVPTDHDEYGQWLFNYIIWLQQQQAELGNSVFTQDMGLSQQMAGIELMQYMLDDPDFVQNMLFEVMPDMAVQTGAAMTTPGTADFALSAGHLVAAIIKNVRGKSRSSIDLPDGTTIHDGTQMSVDAALDAGIAWLGDGYREVENGRYVSEKGMRQFRMLDDCLQGHGGKRPPHVNFNALTVDANTGRTTQESNVHVYLLE